MTFKRVDKNQTEVVKELRKLGFTVALTYAIGKGFPDLVVGYMGYNILVELKSDKGKLTKDEIEFIKKFDGCILISYNVDDIINGFIDYVEKTTLTNLDVLDKLKKIRENRND